MGVLSNYTPHFSRVSGWIFLFRLFIRNKNGTRIQFTHHVAPLRTCGGSILDILLAQACEGVLQLEERLLLGTMETVPPLVRMRNY